MRSPRRKLKVRLFSPPVPERQWLSTEDIRAALKASGQKTQLKDAELQVMAEASSAGINSLLVARQKPIPRDIEASAKSLAAIGRHARMTVKLIFEQLAEQERKNIPWEDDAARLERLRTALASSSSVVLEALIGSAIPTDADTPSRGFQPFFTSLLETDKLATWAEAASERYRNAALRAKEEETLSYVRVLPQLFSRILIKCFVILTGRDPGFSRPSPGENSTNQPGGPLIRFLDHLFARIRNALATHPWTVELATLTEWDPKAETLAAWITKYQADQNLPAPEG